MSLSEEMSLVTKLKALGLPVSNVFQGLTATEERREIVRVAARAVRDVIFRTENGKHVTIEQQFWRAYGCQL